MSPRVSTRLLARQSDRRLLELLGQGHERAFEALVLRYRGELLSYCHRLGLSDGRAEDALQHALLKAWLALQGGTEVRELRAWLYRIVHNTAVNVMRSSPEERALDLDAALIDAATVPESELERTTAAREALAHVAALPPMQRHAMLLSAVEGRSHEEVASALGITDIAVRGLLYRARVTLRAAAAAFTPAPLVGWLSQATSRLAATAAGLPGVSAGGAGSDLGGVLLKGAAVATTAALAAGAVLGPLHAHHAKSRPAPARHALASTETQAADRGGASTSAGPGAQLRLAPGKSSAGPSRTLLRRAGSVGAHARGVPLPSPTSSGTLTKRASGPSSPVPTKPTGNGPARGEGGSGPGGGDVGTVAEVGGGAKGGDGSESDPTSPKSGGGTEGEQKAGGSGEQESETAQEKSENEAEAAREKSEREAEAVREASEREAEARRELEDKASN